MGQAAAWALRPDGHQHHRIKTHDRWQVQQPFPGIYVWRDPHGAFYLVDHTGTRRIASAPPAVVELWYSPIHVEYDAA